MEITTQPIYNDLSDGAREQLLALQNQADLILDLPLDNEIVAAACRSDAHMASVYDEYLFFEKPTQPDELSYPTIDELEQQGKAQGIRERVIEFVKNSIPQKVEVLPYQRAEFKTTYVPPVRNDNVRTQSDVIGLLKRDTEELMGAYEAIKRNPVSYLTDILVYSWSNSNGEDGSMKLGLHTAGNAMTLIEQVATNFTASISRAKVTISEEESKALHTYVDLVNQNLWSALSNLYTRIPGSQPLDLKGTDAYLVDVINNNFSDKVATRELGFKLIVP